MKLKSKIISLLLAVAMVSLLAPPTLLVDTATAADDAFKIVDVQVQNERVAIVYLNNEVGTHFEQYALARSNYLTYYLKLDGEYLHDNKQVNVGADSRIYIRDDKRSFELVLGSSTGTLDAYSGPTFKNEGGTLQFDFKSREFIPWYHNWEEDQQEQSGDVWVRDCNDNPMSEEAVVYAAGSYAAAPILAVEEINILDTRAIYVRFNQRIVLSENNAGQNMTGTDSLLNRAYAGGSNLGSTYNIVGGGATLQASYSYRIDADHPLGTVGEGREFILYYNGDIQSGAEYTYSWSDADIKGLINAAGQNGTSALAGAIPALAAVPASDFKLLKAELTESESGKFEIELTFDRPFAYTRIADASRFRTVNQANNVGAWANKLYDVIDPDLPDADGNRNYYQALFETATGMCGTVLTTDDLKEILTFHGVKAGGRDFLSAFPGDVVIGYFKDSHTIVVNNNNRLAVTLDADATVSIKAGALVGYGTRGSWGTQTVTNPGLANGTVGVINQRTNGPRNTVIGDVAIVKSAEMIPYAEDYDPSWDKGVTATEDVVKFGHNDVMYFQYDGEKDPLIGGFDSRTRHAININNTTAEGLAGSDGEMKYVVQSTYPSIVLENKYVKATIVPSQAARFLHFVFKPTGHDTFYSNPAATNYNIQGSNTLYPPETIGGGTFVLGWLFVWGGTFPVFDGCEHGQIWTSGFDYEVKEYPDGTKSVVCTLKNDQNVQISSGGYVPSSTNTSIGSNFTPFGTGLEYTIEYKLAEDSPVVDMSISVKNPAQVARTYEYYTCNTYAPGTVSEWGHGSMKHIDAVQLLQHQGYNQMVTVNTGEPSNDRSTTDVMPYGPQNLTAAEATDVLPQSVKDRIFGNNIDAGRSNVTGSVTRADFYKYDTMRYMVNHSNSTNFANDLNRLPQADWSGSVNLSNLEGVMRSGKDLMKSTPGIKYWIWNYRQMFDNIPFERDSNNSARPYLEPWPAAGNQYFQNRAISAGETHQWVESYYHTFGLDMATNATPDASALLKFYREDLVDNRYRPVAEVYTTKLEKPITAVLRRNDNGEVVKTYSYVSKIMAHEIIEADTLVPEGTKITLELYEGNTATGDPFFTAWAVQGQAFEADRTSPVTDVVISHQGSIDIPGRVARTGNAQYSVREVFAYNEPFSADGFEKVLWTKVGGDVDEVTMESGATATAPSPTNNWWHSYDYITLRGHEPGSSVVFRATAKDENIANPASRPYAELTVNVKKPLYLKIPNNPGNAAGSTNTYNRNMYSPYHFNLDMTVNLTVAKHDDDAIDGPINIEVWDRANERAAPFISFQVAGLGTHPLQIPAYTLPREEYYKIVARTASGDALGYEYFRVDGYSQIDWSKDVTASGGNINVRYTKKNSNVANTIVLAEDAAAYVNGVPCSVSVGTTTSGANSNTNTLIIAGGNDVAVTGQNTIEVVGVGFAQYPGYTFTVSDTYVK
ncbi:MAG: hypothetical protein LBK75_00275 [Oscillospiraceae bacterium]|nr:hypothetical protein [Oscillospiraceae bacterium]